MTSCPSTSRQAESSSGSDIGRGLLTPVELPFELPTPIYGAMLAIWQLRPAAQVRFPLHHRRPEDYLRFLAWCAVEGRGKYRFLREIPEWDEALSRPASLPTLAADRWQGMLTVGMLFLGMARYRYAVSPMLHSAGAREMAVRDYWERGRNTMLLRACVGARASQYGKWMWTWRVIVQPGSNSIE